MSGILLAALLAAAAEQAVPLPAVKKAGASVTRTVIAPDPAAAREEARRCEEGEGEDAAITACREALRLGVRDPQRAALRQLLARRLADRERYEELIQLYAEDAQEHPGDSEAWRRLGAARLFLRGDTEGALKALQEAAGLKDEADTLVLLGLCLNTLSRHPEAVASFEQALLLDPEALDLRPAARATLEAARRGERWP